jgi:hypothetical protein
MSGLLLKLLISKYIICRLFLLPSCHLMMDLEVDSKLFVAIDERGREEGKSQKAVLVGFWFDTVCVCTVSTRYRVSKKVVCASSVCVLGKI